MSSSINATPEQLASLENFTLLEALFGRRSRRFGAGMEIPDGPLAYKSALPPQPLSALERTLLIAAGAGISGWNFGIPYTESGNADTGCNYTVRPIGRTYPSGSAVYGSEMLITDDSGTYITRMRELDPGRMQEYAALGDLSRIVEWLAPFIVKIGDGRIHIPREFPHLVAHNRWVANQPGSTLFIPVADQIEALFNQIWIRVGEGTAITDHRSGRLLGNPQPLLESGRLIRGRTVSLAQIENNSRVSTTAEISIACYNIQLLLQAMGLGGWLFSGINSLSLLGAYAKDGVPGAGFRFSDTPASAGTPPHALGLDGFFEPLIPPYVKDMHEAARQFANRKFGPQGNYSTTRPSAFRDQDRVKLAIDRPSDAQINYIGSLAQDVLETYGKFPATIPGIAVTTYTQAHHIDTGFYDTFYKDGAYLQSHVDHQRVWHDQK